MGSIAMRQAREILSNVQYVIAIELFCTAQAYDILTENNPMKTGLGTREAYKVIRKHVPYMACDRQLATDIESVVKMIQTDEIIHAVEKAAGIIKGIT